MSIEPALLAFAFVVFAGYAVQTAAGFGSMLICVTFGAHLLGIERVVRLAVPLSVLQTGYIVLRHHDGILWPMLTRRIMPWMLAGMVFAFVALKGLGSAWLGLAFGLMVLALSLRERDAQLLEQVDRIRHIPAIIVQGRYDIVCPTESAFALHKAWPKSKLQIIPDAGHSALEPGIANALVAATNHFRGTRSHPLST